MPTNYRRVEDTTDDDGFVVGGYTAWDCERCGVEVRRYRGQSDVDCSRCGACYNAGGQRLRDDWRDNPAWKYPDLELDDMTGYELEQLGKAGEL